VPGKVRVIAIPARAQPNVRYEIAVVVSSANKTAARRFINKVLGKAGQRKLVAAGFLPIPGKI